MCFRPTSLSHDAPEDQAAPPHPIGSPCRRRCLTDAVAVPVTAAVIITAAVTFTDAATVCPAAARIG